ncbi:M42 family metallopeptidase [Haloarchaeobius sp. HME9146]|uniref:M42 family metallopeptidase n=1 Tax=Haloarchaeobius sp. HME9146 TaxID=2978732 RepID=UPI0021BF205A|nr:M42 family metallopeptidase [Haloarchaeobius sp. HME9146]MCT9096157.1 M42 family metallopeptidase [Haloarchaeobius sp. HME9146]
MTSFDFDYELLVELMETHGAPGYEDAVRDIVRRELDPEVDAIESDGMGNLVGTIEGDSDYSVLVAAHMDEIGFMVRHVDENGFVTIDALGGWDPQILRAERVNIRTEDGDLPGVIGSVPPHTGGEDDDEERTVHDVTVDLGLPADEVDELVSVGDLVTMSQDTEVLGDCISGKSIDNRVSVFIMLELARRIEDPDVTVHFAATVQEEVGLRGAEALGVDVDPDLAIALDTTVANDITGFEKWDHITRLGDGAGIKLKDSSVITNPKVHRRLRAVAEDEDIDHQFEVLPSGGTDTGGLQYSHGALPVGAVSIPTRYLHTPTEVAHADDIAACIDLTAAFLETEDGEHDYTL